MKIAVYGGSFNPVHVGHLCLAEEVAAALGYDKILFVPTFIPPHKRLSASVSPMSRLAMLEIAVKSNPKFEVEPCEIKRGGVSYTVDTVEFLMEKYGSQLDGKFGLILGQEIAAEFSKWKEPDRVAELCDLIIGKRKNFHDHQTSSGNVPRGNYIGGLDARGNFMGLDASFKWPYRELENYIIPVSSTDVRERIASGKSWRYLVPPEVFDYIVTNRLYGYKQ